MALENYRVEPILFDTARPFLKTWHYNPYQNVQAKYCFGLFRPGDFGIPELVGAMVFTWPAGPTAGKSYCPEHPDRCMELRRLACIDDTPKNAESFFVGYALRWLKKGTNLEVIISYADPNFGHEGTIYKASNFEYRGLTGISKVLMVDGKEFHVRTLTMLDRPYGREISRRYKEKDPNVYLVDKPAKHIYVYRLKK